MLPSRIDGFNRRQPSECSCLCPSRKAGCNSGHAAQNAFLSCGSSHSMASRLSLPLHARIWCWCFLCASRCRGPLVTAVSSLCRVCVAAVAFAHSWCYIASWASWSPTLREDAETPARAHVWATHACTQLNLVFRCLYFPLPRGIGPAR